MQARNTGSNSFAFSVAYALTSVTSLEKTREESETIHSSAVPISLEIAYIVPLI